MHFRVTFAAEKSFSYVFGSQNGYSLVYGSEPILDSQSK